MTETLNGLLNAGTAIYNYLIADSGADAAIDITATGAKCADFAIVDTDTGEILSNVTECEFPEMHIQGNSSECEDFEIVDLDTGKTIGYESECSFSEMEILGDASKAARVQTQNNVKRFATAKVY